jgi:fibronectin type 3 domain-containing protein
MMRLMKLLAVLAFLPVAFGCPPVVTPSETQILAAPGNVRTAVVSSTCIRVQWDLVTLAEGYHVYRGTTPGGTFTQVGGATPVFPPYDDAGLLPNTVYWYKVTSVKEGVEQSMSVVASGLTNLTVPGNLVVLALAPLSLTVRWDAAAEAEGYNLYRSSQPAGTFVRCNTGPVTALEYADTPLSEASTYWYKVVALKTGTEQDPSSPVSGVTMLGSPHNPRVSYQSSSVLHMTWDALAGADGYNAYRATAQDGSYSLLNGSPIMGTAWDDSGLASNTLYWYKVAGVRGGTEQTISSASRGFTAQAWARSYGGTSDDTACAVQPMSDGALVVAGQSNSVAYYNGTCWVVKLDAGGGVSWQKAYEDCRSSFFGVRQSTDGGLLVAGSTVISTTTFFTVAKLDSGGGVSWRKLFSRSTYDATSKCMDATSDGGCIVAGTTYLQTLVAKIGPDGTLGWGKIYGMNCSPAAVRPAADGGYFLAGSNRDFGAGSYDCWVLKLDAAGAVTWQKVYGGTGWDTGSDVCLASDGGCMVAGTLNGEGWLLRLDSSGAILWQKRFPGVASLAAIEPAPDGGCFLAGYISVSSDLWIARLDSTGAISTQRSFIGPAGGTPLSVRQTVDGGLIVAGSTDLYGRGGHDYWLIKLPASLSLEGSDWMTVPFITPQDATASAADTTVTPTSAGLLTGNPSSTVTDTNAGMSIQYP